MKEVEIKSVQRTVEYIGRNCNKEVKNHAVVRNHISLTSYQTETI